MDIQKKFNDAFVIEEAIIFESNVNPCITSVLPQC
jgi:hypothetical protein